MLSNTSSKPSVLPYKELEESVWKKDICAGCRACITICPGNTLAYDNTENKPYQNTPCVDCKACVDVCPRMSANYGAFLSTELIGPYIDIKSVKAGTGVLRAQNGGVVTALLTTALEEELVDCAVVMGADRWLMKAHPRIAYYPEELNRAAGSKYDSNGILEALKDIAKDDSVRHVAIVGTPCVMESIGLLRASTNEYAIKLSQKIRFAIGLFCFEVFGEGIVTEVSKRLGIPSWRISSMNAGEGKMTVSLRDGEIKTIPLSSLSEFVRKGCKVCPDFTSKSADISVGSVGSKPGLSTVIIRTTEGMGLYQIAEDLQFIEVIQGADTAVIEKVGKLKLKRNAIQ